MSLHIPLLLAYSILQIALGLWIGRRVRGAKDFFVAGRQLGPGLIFATMLAANIGAGSTVGAAGLGYRDGLSAWWWVGSAGVGSIVLALFVGPRMRRVAAEQDLRTVGDFLEWRYGRSVRGIIAALLWVGTLAILAGQLIALAWMLNVITGLPKAAGCLLGGALVTTYFMAGGLLTSAWVNVVQLTVKLVGFAVALPLAVAAAGGLGQITATWPTPTYWHFMEGGASGWPYLALLAPAFIVSPGLLQKIYGARDDRAVRLGVGLNAVGLLAFAVLSPMMGIVARMLHPALGNQELALPTLLMSDLPPAVGSLGLAAVFSAELSSADAVLFMLSTSLSQDLFKRYVRPDADDRTVLRVARAAALAGGICGIALAIVSPSVIGALSVFYSLLGVSLFVPILAGLYVRSAGVAEALAAIGGGVAGLLFVRLGAAPAAVAQLTAPVVGLLASAGAFLVATVVSRVRQGTSS